MTEVVNDKKQLKAERKAAALAKQEAIANGTWVEPQKPKKEKPVENDEVVADERQQHSNECDDVADLYHCLPADLVHCHGGRDGEKQEPDEYHRRNESREGLAEVEILFYVTG